ncbi:uncharacterized protein LOC113168488 isoform X2 [Anabas testudineus]|uniref:uncharacterized protein LOC113168488 isoform X2 n=1 Tax=Anabas testudineus TaxID=64144 RepID=UPI00143DAFC4|nr:uncharacterized protein LOC113168488 isoform X2 [Anabas testudineus]
MKMVVVFVILLYVSHHALGVEVYEGDESVLLSCQVSVSDSERSTVVWSREDLKYPTVHVRQQSGDELLDQNKNYRNRTSMRTDSLQTGDLSLTLRKPTISDSDTYTCTVRRMGKQLSQTEVELLVREPPPVWPWVLVLAVLTLLAVVGVVLYVRRKRKKKRRAAFQVGMTEVTEGVESVLLPFKTSFTGNVTVKWIRSGAKPMTVHVNENGQNKPHKQDNVFKGRTEMKDDLLGSGDLSLTLSKPCINDRGVYICTVYKDGRLLTEKRVALCVKAFQVATVEVTEGVESVLLPFITTAGLPDDVTVVWEVTVPQPRTVHVYENGQHNRKTDKQDMVYKDRTEMKEDLLRTGDVSLTLKNPRVEDGGVYVCKVNRDLENLNQKRMTLCVKACQVEKVEVTEGVDSVLLPFQTRGQLAEDVTVEWRCSDPKPMMVHVYQNGQNQHHIQDENYKGRTAMKSDPERTGDLSLILSNPNFDDGGVYICNVNKDGNILTQKIVVLCIQEDWKKTMENLYQEDTEKGNSVFSQLIGFLNETVTCRTRSSSTDPSPLMADPSVDHSVDQCVDHPPSCRCQKSELVMNHLKDITDPLLEPLQFAYRKNSSVDDAANLGLHYILQHLDLPGTYVRILFVDFSSAFNTITLGILDHKLTQLTVPAPTCQWIKSFLTDRRQQVRLGSITSGTRTISTGSAYRQEVEQLVQ